MTSSSSSCSDHLATLSRVSGSVQTAASVTSTASRVVGVLLPVSGGISHTISALGREAHNISEAALVLSVSADMATEVVAEEAPTSSSSRRDRSCCLATAETAENVSTQSNRVRVIGIVVSGVLGVGTVLFPPVAPVTVPLIGVAHSITTAASVVSGVALGTELVAKGAMAFQEGSPTGTPLADWVPESDFDEEDSSVNVDKSHRYRSCGF